MKNKMFLKLCASALAVLSLTAVTNAKSFTKTNEYTEGKFTDVPEKQWYAAEVKSAYELGFMNGQSDTLFAPEGNVTVAEGITMASRVHAIYNGKEIKSVEGGKWYDMYIAYAKENGLITEGQFTNYDRNIMRYEMAVMFANAMPADYLTAKNDIKDIPDVAETEEYYDDLMMLYKAGVVLGSDDYGNFYATNPIKRSETAAIINRVALPENRKEGTLKEYGDRNPAVYLIDDWNMTRTPRSINYIASGWQYDNRALFISAKKDYSTNVLSDISTEHDATISKEVYTVTSGNLQFESQITTTGNGLRLYFEDLEGNSLFEITTKNSALYAIGAKEEKICDFERGTFKIIIYFDMDDRTAEVVIRNELLGTYALADAADFSRVCIGTTVKDIVDVTPSRVMLMWNYNVNDTFRMCEVDDKPYGWTLSDSAKVVSTKSTDETMSMAIDGKGSAVRKFEAVSDTFVYETYFRVPQGQSATLAIKNGNSEAVKIEAKDGKITSGGKAVRNYTMGVWQQVRVEADTNKDTALIKINGKACLTVPFTQDAVDTIEITADGKGIIQFDDVLVFNTYEYPDYCPTPVPVNDDEWSAGMNICSLWREGYHYGWDCISPYDDVAGVLGFYDEGIPEAMDWEIKMMVEHGYDYQRFCWYYGNASENIKMPRLCVDAIHDGYFNAKYSDMLDFSIMWENAGGIGKPEEFYENIWPYWVDWYLTDERYLVIDNKPVITICSYSTFKKNFGGTEEGVKEVVNFMDAECKKLGYDGVIMINNKWTTNPKVDEELIRVGFDAEAIYHFGDYGFTSQFQEEYMTGELEGSKFVCLASVGTGFNDIGWTETRTPLATVEEFEKILTWSRDYYNEQLKSRGDVEEWKYKSIFSCTWNEHGEGHYLFPSEGLYGFGYIDAHRKVFSSVAGQDDSKHFDVVPTHNQLERLGYLYQARYIPLRKTQYISEDESEYATLDKVASWNFENEEDCKLWKVLAKSTPPVYNAEEKALCGTTTDPDGHITPYTCSFKAEDVRFLHFVMKVDKNQGSSGEIYFKTDPNASYTAAMGKSFSIIADGEYHDYYIDLSALSTWSGNIVALRFDPINVAGNYYIKCIEFLSPISQNSLKINVDGIKSTVTSLDYYFEDGELYVAGNPSDGYYSMNAFSYKWNRWTGKLELLSYNGTEIILTVGSDKALVNGVEKALKKKVELYDGLVMLPMIFIYDNIGANYKLDGKNLTVSMRGTDYLEILENRVPYEFEFLIPGDNEGWTVGGGGVASVKDGMLTSTSVFNGTRYDPTLTLKSLAVETRKCPSATVRLKIDYHEKIDQSVVMYFATSNGTSLSESKTVRVDTSKLTPDKDGFYEITFDFTSNENWTGTTKEFRLDPTNSNCTFTIDYIRFNIIDFEKEYAKADDGNPFYIPNADAQNPNIYDLFSNGMNDISIVDDDLRPGNKAFLIAPKNKDKKVWAYFMAPTRFKAGVTYKIDFEYRLVGDLDGNEANDIPFSVNFRYDDFNSDGSFASMKDHALAPKTSIDSNKASTSDGWIQASVTYKINESSNSRGKDYFCIFTDPIEKDGVVYNHQYMLDNFVVTVVE